jgi:hypothetical protein
MPTVPRNISSLESGAERIWASSDPSIEDTCRTLKPTSANRTPTVRTIAVDAPSPGLAAKAAASRAPAQARPARKATGPRTTRQKITGLARTSGSKRRTRHNALARKSVQAPLEIIYPPPGPGGRQERLFDAARAVTLAQVRGTPFRDEPAVVEEKKLVAHAFGEGEILGREQHGGTGIADVPREAPQDDHALPSSGLMRPAIMKSVVVLPHPLGPTSPAAIPGSTARVRPLTTALSP